MHRPRPRLQSETGGKTSPIPRQSLGAAVVERLREKILSGELRDGQQLRQHAIAAEFQISRIPVRKALSHLGAEGLITLVANRGEIMELFETRAVLECYMLRCSIPRMKPEDFRHAEDVLRRYEASLEKDSEVESWGRWNWSFHSALYAPANRPKILSLAKNLNVNCDRYTRLHVVVTRDQQRAGQAHRELLEVCERKDARIAADAPWKHITEAGQYLKEFTKRHREQHL